MLRGDVRVVFRRDLAVGGRAAESGVDQVHAAVRAFEIGAGVVVGLQELHHVLFAEPVKLFSDLVVGELVGLVREEVDEDDAVVRADILAVKALGKGRRVALTPVPGDIDAHGDAGVGLDPRAELLQDPLVLRGDRIVLVIDEARDVGVDRRAQRQRQRQDQQKGEKSFFHLSAPLTSARSAAARRRRRPRRSRRRSDGISSKRPCPSAGRRRICRSARSWRTGSFCRASSY